MRSAPRDQRFSTGPPETIPLSQRIRIVLILIDFHDSEDAIQQDCRNNIIDVTLQTPPEGNRWLNPTALFTIGELIGADSIFRTMEFSTQ